MSAARDPLPPPDPPPDAPTTPATAGGAADADGAARQIVPRLAVGAILVAVFIAAFGALAAVVEDQELNALDAVASPLVHALATPTLDALMTGASTVGSVPSLLVLTTLAALLALARRRPGIAVFLAVASIGGMVLNEGLKRIVGRPRPTLDWATAPPGSSFPSGHTMDSIIVLVAVAFMVWALFGARAGRVAAAVAVGLALLIGVSRIYLGAHYLTDVVGGWLAGAIWLIVVTWAFRAAGRRRAHGDATRHAV